jgi:hypothetical protein
VTKSQRALTILASILFCVTLWQAPWELSRSDYSYATKQIERRATSYHAPVWDSGPGQTRLKVEVLAVEWLAIGLLYTAVFFLLRGKGGAASLP